MDRINFNHLRCFWAVVRDGSIAKACETLDLTQPTISKQIGDLEDSLNCELFRRTGRRLVPTDMGRRVYAYADEIFTLSNELSNVLRGGSSGKPSRLHVGVSDVVPKLLTRLVLEPALDGDLVGRLVCREGKTEHLLAQLALSQLDVVITDAPLPAGAGFRAFGHKLGESSVGVYGSPSLARKFRKGFPESLDAAPWLLPAESTTLRRSVEHWFQAIGANPRVVAEFEDSALMKAFAQKGHGLMLAPTAVGKHIREQFGVEQLGIAENIREPIYAITLDRRVTHPGLVAILENARAALSKAPSS